jgi:hypothetical protein
VSNHRPYSDCPLLGMIVVCQYQIQRLGSLVMIHRLLDSTE